MRNRDLNKRALVTISSKLKQKILRELNICEDDWSQFHIDVMLNYIGDQPFVFSSVALSDQPV